jgi:hypothetical protein
MQKEREAGVGGRGRRLERRQKQGLELKHRRLTDSRGVIFGKVTTFCFSRTHDLLLGSNQANMGRNSGNNGTSVREISKTPVFGKITASLSG